MKYIMFKRQLESGITQKLPVLFPSELVHADMAKAVLALDGMEKAEAVSAGEWSPIGGCSGRSETLKLKSHISDTAIIVMHDYYHGFDCS